MNKIRLIFVTACLASFTLFGAPPDKTALGGSWTNPNNWYPVGVPGDNQRILIPDGVTQTNYGQNVEMDNSVLVVRGTLSMESSCDLCPDYGQIKITGEDGGVIIEDGGTVSDDTYLGGGTHYIEVGEPAEKVWSGDACVFSCGTVVGTYTSTGETAWPSSLQNPLPVEFLFFEADFENGVVLLKWATATEVNNDRFSIERSQDGVAFTEVGQVLGYGNSKERLDYQYTDETASGDFSGEAYYRLKQLDYDGRHEYSEIAMVLIGPLEAKLSNIKPNPFESHLSMSLIAAKEEEIKVDIYDMDGRKMFTEQMSVNKGVNLVEVGYLDQIPEGIYFVNVTGSEFAFRERIVK